MREPEDGVIAQCAQPTDSLVRWQVLAAVGESLLLTADGPFDAAVASLHGLLDRITAPHRLLEQLEIDADGVIAGDPLAARRLASRLSALAATFPGIAGSTQRARQVSDEVGGEDRVAQSDTSTLSFDAVTRLAAASAVATSGGPPALRDDALDIIVGLALRASAADRLSRGLADGGAPGVAVVLNEMRLAGHSLIAPSQPPMQTMGGAPIGIPGLPEVPGLPRRGPQLGAEVPGAVKDLLDALRGTGRWNSERINDRAPLWHEIAGLSPPEMIHQDELARVRCMNALVAALKQRQELPPPRPSRVLWSDSIASVTPSSACSGDRIVIHGRGFGAARADIGVMLPTAEGCRAFAVAATDWTPTAITITLPVGIVSGPLGLVDLTYVQAYDDWAARMNAITKSIIENAKCSRSKAPDVAYEAPFRECATRTPVNGLRAGLPVIRAFKVNGRDLAVVEPGQPVWLEWDLVNVDSFDLRNTAGTGPRFSSSSVAQDPPGVRIDLGPFIEKRSSEASYELRAVGPCGTVSATVTVLLRKVPQLSIVGIEVTQGIQVFREPGSPDHAIPLVAHKDTVVRVYVAVENLGDFAPKSAAGEVDVSGELRVYGAHPAITLAPMTVPSTVTARPNARIDRRETKHTLNFKIPFAAASSDLYNALRVTVWAIDEVETVPAGVKIRPTASASAPVAWVTKRPFKVHFVRVSTNANPALSEAKAHAAILAGFAMLATPATDVWPARVPTWHTSYDLDSKDDYGALLSHIDDQHDCTLSEALFPWEEDCPDADGAVWLGILPSTGALGGRAQSYRAFDASRSTAIAHGDATTIAHELGHTLKLNHVNPSVGCSGGLPKQDGAFDALPDGGAIKVGDAFDPTVGGVVKPDPGAQLYDIMTYACDRWVTRVNWMRVFDKF